MEEYKYEDLLDLDNLNSFEPEQVWGILGLIFETSREKNDITSLQRGLEFSSVQKLEAFTDHDKTVFYYYVSNGWSYFHKLSIHNKTTEPFQNQLTCLEGQIINLRKALIYFEKIDDYMKCQILTNLGNCLDHVGRFVEAIEYWKRAIEIIPSFGMAVGNLGFGLVHYAKVLYDEGHRFLFCQFAHQYLIKGANSEEVYKEAKDSFYELIKIIEDRYGKENIEKKQDLSSFSLGLGNDEIGYRKWCIKNTLFLNPVNDLVKDNIVAHDCLFLPSMVMEIEHPPVYQNIYNQLKQEFVSVRYLYFQSIKERKSHYSDRDNMQVDTLDYSIYSLNTEKLKISFRILYSLFDKIGYFLNSYFKIGMKPYEVTFKKIWSKKINGKSELNPFINNSQNWALRGLFWVSKDLMEDDTEFSYAILPEAKEIATIRNFIEHKSFKIIDFGNSDIVDDGLTYQISRVELEQKVLLLMKMVRAALIYLSLAVHLEEVKKEKQITIPIPFIKLEDENKR